MLTHLELAKLIDTMAVRNSKAEQFMGRTIRMPSLVPGTLYIMRQWTIAHQVNSDNPFMVVEFVGAGHQGPKDKSPKMFDKNPMVKNMGEHDFYYFKAVHGTTSEIYEFGAYMHEGAICITSSAVRVTCSEIAQDGATSVVKQVSKPAAKPVRKSEVTGKKLTLSAGRPAYWDYDENEPLPGVIECHPLTMVPYKNQRRAA